MFLPVVILLVFGAGCASSEGEDDDATLQEEVSTQVEDNASQAIDNVSGDAMGSNLSDEEVEDALMGDDEKK